MRGLSLAKKNGIIRAWETVSVTAKLQLEAVVTYAEIVAYANQVKDYTLSQFKSNTVREKIRVIRLIIKTVAEGLRLKELTEKVPAAKLQKHLDIIEAKRNLLKGYMRDFEAVFQKRLVFAA